MALAVLELVALFRMISAPEPDAVTIAVLGALLFWVQWAEWRRTRAMDAKVDQLLTRPAGHLTADDLDIIEALKAQTRRLARPPGT